MTVQAIKSGSFESFVSNYCNLGFELETQSVAGKTYNEWRNGETISREVTREIPPESNSEFLSRISRETQKAYERSAIVCFRKLYKLESCHWFPVIIETVQYKLGFKKTSRLHREGTGFSYPFDPTMARSVFVTMMQQLIASSEGETKETLSKLLKQYYYMAIEEIAKIAPKNTQTQTITETVTEVLSGKNLLKYKGLSDYCANPDNFDWKGDGSVHGYEITTVGGNRATNVIENATRLFAELENIGGITVDAGCSFHIHLSADNVRPQYTQAFQAKMIRNVLNNSEVPECVRERWTNQYKRNSYFSNSLVGSGDRARYSFVAFRQDTWEFRAFGNVSNANDAVTCLKIAAKAYYDALLDTEVMSLPIGVSFESVANYACNNRITFDAALEILTSNSTMAS